MRTETYATTGSLAVTLRLPAGQIDVETGDAPEATVELEALRGEEDDVTIDLRQSGSGQELRVVVPSGLRKWRAEYRVAIRVPHGASVDAALASADLDARGRLSSVDVKAASGSVRVHEVQGGLAVDTASGDVFVRSVGGSATIRSASGEVAVREALSDLRVQTASGDLSVGSVERGTVKLQSASGDIDVAVKHGSKVWIDARSMSGDTSSELDVGTVPPAGDGPLVELRLATMSGDIAIRRAGDGSGGGAAP